ncbi:hypothetical protein QCA50_007812 [Cerrena zonata]|uniref:Uncharacterized protein n=1 Tax=Cerrena zonata TaxID=2478898 RepID=A0AAW0G703_9APHY
MSLNDKDATLIGARGVDVHPGVANPTESSTHSDPLANNFVTDPTSDSMGAGVSSSRFTGHQDARKNFAQTAGVVEGRPGIIESTNIDPLSESSNKDDGWANARSTNTTGISATANGALNQAASAALSAAGWRQELLRWLMEPLLVTRILSSKGVRLFGEKNGGRLSMSRVSG